MTKYATIRVAVDDLERLRDALATGEDIAEAAAVIAAAPESPQALFTSPKGLTFRADQAKAVSILTPQVDILGDVVLPVRLRWLKGVVVGEARGSVTQAHDLAQALGAL